MKYESSNRSSSVGRFDFPTGRLLELGARKPDLDRQRFTQSDEDTDYMRIDYCSGRRATGSLG